MFRRTITEMTDSWVWELSNQAQNRIPDPIDYIEMRRKTFGSDLTMSLSRLAHSGSAPADVYRLRPVVAMENAAADYACLLNDVFSYQKEIQFEGEIHNAVLVVQNFLDCDAAEAMRVVGELMNARMRQFQHIVGTELPALTATLHLGSAARDAIDGHARNLQDWMSGILNWHEGCHRYGEADLARNARSAQPRPARPIRLAHRDRHVGGPHRPHPGRPLTAGTALPVSRCQQRVRDLGPVEYVVRSLKITSGSAEFSVG